jgi:hypothetical protein
MEGVDVAIFANRWYPYGYLTRGLGLTQLLEHRRLGFVVSESLF